MYITYDNWAPWNVRFNVTFHFLGMPGIQWAFNTILADLKLLLVIEFSVLLIFF